MASILHLANKGVRNHDLGLRATGFVVNGGVEFGSGLGINYLRCKYRDNKFAQKAPLLAAVLGKAASVATNLFAHGAVARVAAGAFDSLGGAGLALVGAECGARLGNKASNVQVVVLPAGAALPAGGRQVSMGALPPAEDGDALSWGQLMQLRQGV